MTPLSTTDFAGQLETLPGLPAVAQQIITIAESSGSSAQEAARVLRKDPATAARRSSDGRHAWR